MANKTVYIWGEQVPLFIAPWPIINTKEDFQSWKKIDENNPTWVDPYWGELSVSYVDIGVVSPIILKNATENHIQIKTNQWDGTTILTGTRLFIRGSATSFNQFSVNPAWQEYTAPIYQPTWRYIQIKVVHDSSSSSSSSSSSVSSSSSSSNSLSSSSCSSSSQSSSSSSKSSSSKSSSSESQSSSSQSSSSSSSFALSPTTWNPSDKNANINLSGGDLIANSAEDNGSGYFGVRATRGYSSGKRYFELNHALDFAFIRVGIANLTQSLATGQYPGSSGNSYGYDASTGKKYHNGIGTSYGDTWQNHVIGIALDMNAGKGWWSKDGVWQNSGNPAAGTNPAYTSISGTFYPMIAPYGSFGVTMTITGVFASGSMTYSPPSGFSAWDD